MLAIPPAQGAAVHAGSVQDPDPEAVAERVVAAFAAVPARKAGAPDGRMLDAPHLAQAERGSGA